MAQDCQRPQASWDSRHASERVRVDKINGPRVQKMETTIAEHWGEEGAILHAKTKRSRDHNQAVKLLKEKDKDYDGSWTETH